MQREASILVLNWEQTEDGWHMSPVCASLCKPSAGALIKLLKIQTNLDADGGVGVTLCTKLSLHCSTGPWRWRKPEPSPGDIGMWLAQ